MRLPIDRVASLVTVETEDGVTSEWVDATVDLKLGVVVVTQERAGIVRSYKLEEIERVEWHITPLPP